MKPNTYDRWETYVLESGASLTGLLRELRATRESSKKVCLILGQGFDPRMLDGLEMLSEVFMPENIAVIVLVFEEGTTSPSQKYTSIVEDNLARLKAVISEKQVEYRVVSMFSSEGRRITSRSAEAIFRLPAELEPYSDIFVDVSSLPRSVYFPVVAKLLYLLDSMADRRCPNLFVLVSENAQLDKLIVEEGIDEDAGYIHPFRGGMDRESAASIPRVWFPLLGERQDLQLRRIHDLINPAEICPLLPSPSTNPRRSDDLILEYREMLFDQLRVETKNFLYASETNPFEVYRQLRRAVSHYSDALRPLGGSNAIISANSSKLLSVGALLAAYELKRGGVDIAIAHVETHGYTMDRPTELTALAKQGKIHGLWVSGECYA